MTDFIDDKIHYLNIDSDGIELPSEFTFPFHYTPHPLTVKAAHEVQNYIASRTDWTEELSAGKMFGVLIVQTPDEKVGYLAAFSGNLAGSNLHQFFVPPVYDLLQPDGFFRIEEANISAINKQIKELEGSQQLKDMRSRLAACQAQASQTLADAKQQMKEAVTEHPNFIKFINSYTPPKDSSAFRCEFKNQNDEEKHFYITIMAFCIPLI